VLERRKGPFAIVDEVSTIENALRDKPLDQTGGKPLSHVSDDRLAAALR
jgi:hypothetical protein